MADAVALVNVCVDVDNAIAFGDPALLAEGSDGEGRFARAPLPLWFPSTRRARSQDFLSKGFSFDELAAGGGKGVGGGCGGSRDRRVCRHQHDYSAPASYHPHA